MKREELAEIFADLQFQHPSGCLFEHPLVYRRITNQSADQS